MILSTAYAPPIQYFCKLEQSPVLIEGEEHFIKQTYRNRCRVLSANGISELVIPVEQGASEQCPIRDVRISDHDNWRTRHWQTLRSCYGLSPYFEYYADDIYPFYTKRYPFLFDFNWELTQTIANLMHLSISMEVTEQFIVDYEEDYRFSLRPKKSLTDPSFVPAPYYQLFVSRDSFVPNLSIFDLLFNMGPEGILLLQKCRAQKKVNLEII